MAVLKSEDKEYVSSFTLSPQSKVLIAKDNTFSGQAIQHFNWQIRYGNREIIPAKNTNVTNEDIVQDGYILFRKPIDEVKQLTDELSHLCQKKKDAIIFEPSEPSIDLSITRQGDYGLKVQIFIDEGSVESGISRFDAIGIRFFTTEEQLALFINELKNEFN